MQIALGIAPAIWYSHREDSSSTVSPRGERRGMPHPWAQGTSLEEITITRRLGGLCLGLIAVVLSTNPGSAGVLDASWTAPVTNTDGSQLTDLGFYRLYYAVSPGAPCPGATFIQVASPTTTPGGETISARIRGLTTGTSYTAAVTAVDVNGSESPCSGTAGAVAGSDFSVTPTTSVNFGSVDIGSVAEQVFVVQNTRDGTVNGTVSVAAPFSVVSGSSFTLVGNGATQNVRVRFTPTSAVLSTTNVSFSADGDVVTRTMAGIGVGTAPPAAGSTFTGWSGSGCTGMGSCTVTMTASRAVTASFGGQSFALTVNKSGPGTGTVSSAPAGISCGATCSASFSSGTTVTLTAAPNTGSTFTGWSGSSCTGTGTCTVTMTAARSVTAAFGAQALSLTVSPTTGPVGTQFTATLSNWTGAGWIALAPAGSPDSAFGAWAYVSSLATVGNTKTWSVTPPTAGSYEIRLYSDGFTRAGTSPAFTVSAAGGPPPGGATVGVSPTTGLTGAQFTVTVTNWTGGGWIALAPAGSPDSAYGQWTYVSSLPGAGTKTWNVIPPTAGSYEARLYSNGFTRAGTAAFTVADPVPTLAVSPTSGAAGTPFTVTLTDWMGAGWIALAPAGSADGAYIAWAYVSSLATVGNTKTWSVTPPTPGTYEIRLYSNGFTRAATSSPFTGF